MTKRSPTAASLAKPQYRQRVRDDRRAKQLAELDASLRGFCEAFDLEYNPPEQLEGWQEPLRQMEG